MPGEVARVPLPKDHKAAICIWADLSVTQTEAILAAAGNREEIQRFLIETFQLQDHDKNPRSAILLDLYFFTIQFAIESDFNKEQTSTFFSIVKMTHEVCIETPFGNLEQCFNYFKELVLCHAVKRPPWSINLFSPDQIHLITEYVLNTYFRHFKLYKYAFTPVVKLDLSVSYVGLPETPEPEEEQQETCPDEVPVGSCEKTDGEGTDGAEQIEEPQEKESPAHQELRKIITAQLNQEIEKLRASLDEQIKLNDESLQQKLSLAEGLPSGKASRGSTKGKKK